MREALEAESRRSTASDDGSLAGPFTAVPFTDTTLAAHVEPRRRRRRRRTGLRLEAQGTYAVPFFGWFVGFQAWLAARGALQGPRRRVVARVEGRDPPPKPRRWPIVPPVPFTTEQAARLAALAFVAMVANFCGGLLTQNGDAVTRHVPPERRRARPRARDRPDRRAGVARGDRARRPARAPQADPVRARPARASANLVAGLAPSFEVFTGAQLFTRAFVNACLVVAGIAAVEEAPEGARAFATAMFALALGVGIALGVIFLPVRRPGQLRLADLLHRERGRARSFSRSSGDNCGRRGDTRRLVGQSVQRGRLREVFTSHVSRPVHPARSRGVHHERVHRTVVAAHQPLPHPRPRLLQLRCRGLPHRHRRLARSDRRAPRRTPHREPRPPPGRRHRPARSRPRSRWCSSSRTTTPLLWVAPTIAIVAAACAGLALGTLDAELFPTETRGTSNGFLLVAGVAGSAVGTRGRDSAPRRDGRPRTGHRDLRDTDAHRGGVARSPTPRDGVTRAGRREPDRMSSGASADADAVRGVVGA